MSDKESSGNVIEEATIALKYKVLGESAFKRFMSSMDSIKGGAQSKKFDVKISVDNNGLKKLKQLQSALTGIAKQVTAKVDVIAPAAKTRRLSQRAPQQDDFVGPRKPVPITWPNKASGASAQASSSHGNIERSTTPRNGGVVVTADQIRELGSAAKAAAASVREGARRAAAGLNPPQLRGAIDSSARSLIGSRSRFDPYAADTNLDRAHAAGSFSSLRFNRAAPDMSRMSFSPAQGARSGRVRIPTPDMTAFKRAIENLRQYVGRAGREMQQRLNIEPRVKESGMRGGLQNAMTQLGVGAMSVGFGRVLDEAQHLQDQIRALTPTIAEATAAQKGLFEASKDTNSSYKTAVDIYSALAVMKDKTKLDPSQAVEVVRSIQAASQIGGGSAAGQERAIAQVEKAIAMNKLTVIGLNSIERQSRGITVALAEGLGVTVADLRKMSHEGKIGAEEISQALLKMAPEMQKRLGKVRVTFGNLKNFANTVMLEWATRLSDNWDGWGKGMQKVRDAMAGLNNFMSGAFDKLSSVLGGGENAAKAVQYAFLALGGGAVLAAVWAFGGAVLAALWPVTVAAGAVFAAIIAIDDILGWMSGKKSVMGDMVGPFEKWKPMLDDIGKSFGELGKAWSGFWGGSDGMSDALNGQSEEPPLVKCFKNMLETVKDAIEAVKQLLILMTAIRDGDWDAAMHAAAESAANAGGAVWNASPIKNASDSGWLSKGLHAMWDYSAPGSLGRAASWLGGDATKAPDKYAVSAAGMSYGNQAVTTNNSPTVNVYANSDDPAGLARMIGGEVSKSMQTPMLPNVERGPR